MPDAEIRRLLTAALGKYGGTGTEDLVKRVARQLGFKRTGPKIRERVADQVNKLAADGSLAVSGDGRIRPIKPAPEPLIPDDTSSSGSAW